jgi:hypothetical protein
MPDDANQTQPTAQREQTHAAAVAGRTDIALINQHPGWHTIPVASSQGDGSWKVTNGTATEFTGWAQIAGVRVVTGDFNGNGRTDIALVNRGPGWTTIPIAFSQADGSWKVTNKTAPEFTGWVQIPGVQMVTGDFNGNGRTDIALVNRGPGWTTIPIASAQSDGSWKVTNKTAPEFAGWATIPGVRVVTGDFNGNGRTDIALVNQHSGWTTIPIAFSQADGSWKVTNEPAPEFAGWASIPGVRVVTGDFNGNGRTDIALVNEGPGWHTIPIAFSQGNGSWKVTNEPAPEFAGWAQITGVRVLTGDFNGNGRTDIALVNQGPGWHTIPIAFSQGNGSWKVTNGTAPQFAGWADIQGVQVVTGDFNNNGRTDIALVNRQPGWHTIPIAFSQGDGNWVVTNESAPEFAGWATIIGVELVPGDFR